MITLDNVDKPLKKDKGLKNGSCNRRACQRPGAIWFNRGTDKYYCFDCAHIINYANRDAYKYVDGMKEGDFLCIKEN